MSGYPDSHLSRTIGKGRKRIFVALIPLFALLLWFVYLWSVSSVLTKTEKYPDGAIKAEGYLRRDANGDYVRHGRWIEFHPNGQKSGEGHYDLGEKRDNWVYWDADGRASQPPSEDDGSMRISMPAE